MSFTGDLSKFTDAVEKNHNTVVKKVSFDMASKIIKRTPVDTGRAKANWHVELNNQRMFTTDDTDTRGASTIAEAASEINKVKIGDSVYITNNLPYIEELENGSSQQAPAGMVKVTAAEFKRTVDAAAKAIIKKSLGDIA
jgi:uncharacterized protein CbrC (UPF0167 family)